MIKYLFILLLLPFIAMADTASVNNFSLGLNTAGSDLWVPLGASRICHNIDLGDGNLKVRLGYDSVFCFKGGEAVRGLGTLYKSDGTQRMFAVVDSVGVGYGNIYASNEGSSEFGSTIDSFYIIPDTTNWGECSGKLQMVSFYGLEVSVAGYLNTTIYSDSVYCDTVDNTGTADPDESGIGIVCSVMVARLNASPVATYFTMTNHDTAFSMVEKSNYSTVLSSYISTPPCIGYCSKEFTITSDTLSLTDHPNRIWTNFPIQHKARFAQFDDELYIVPGGDGRGVVISDLHNGLIARSYPYPAPGEPLIISLDDTGSSSTYTLNGEYKYGFRAKLKTAESINTLNLLGNVSSTVRVNSGRVLLKSFQLPAMDSLYGDSIPYDLGAGDTVKIEVYRSKANPGGIIQDIDYFYNTELSLYITDDTCWSGADTFTSLALAMIYDSIPDDSLGDSLVAITDSLVGRDSTRVVNSRYGAPGYVGCEVTTGYDTLDANDDSAGIFYGIPTQADTLGVVYACAFFDTLTMNRGNRGPYLAVWKDTSFDDAGENYKSITIGLPRVSPADTGLAINIYRGLIYQVGRDTGGYYLVNGSRYESAEQYNASHGILSAIHNRIGEHYIRPGYAVDSIIVSDFKFLAQVPATDTIYVDSVRYDSLILNTVYEDVEPPAVLENIVAHDNRLWGYNKSLLYYSRADSVKYWRLWDIKGVNRDDGDVITGIWADQTSLRVSKYLSNYIYYDDYTRLQIVGRWGCIAPHSLIFGSQAYYLSAAGVVGERAGKMLERTVDEGLVSGFLRNFDDLSLSYKKDMVGMYLPIEQKALFSLGDTTYVFDEKANRLSGGVGGWSTWGFSFAGGCLYDTENELDFTPGKTFYFFKDDDSLIYSYGTSTTDKGDSIRVEWESGPIAPSRWKSQVFDVGLWISSTDSDDSTLALYVIGENGDTVATAYYSDLDSARYHLKDIAANAGSQYFQIYIVSNKSVANTVIDMIDFRYDRAEPTIRK